MANGFLSTELKDVCKNEGIGMEGSIGYFGHYKQDVSADKERGEMGAGLRGEKSRHVPESSVLAQALNTCHEVKSQPFGIKCDSAQQVSSSSHNA